MVVEDNGVGEGDEEGGGGGDNNACLFSAPIAPPLFRNSPGSV